MNSELLIPPRYEPGYYETEVLKEGLIRYYAYPEQSTMRNHVVREISICLTNYSIHWTPHNVRVWFNNHHSLLPAGAKKPTSNLELISKLLLNGANRSNFFQVPNKIKKDLIISISHYYENTVNQSQKLVINDTVSIHKSNFNKIEIFCNRDCNFEILLKDEIEQFGFQNEKMEKMRQMKQMYKEINFQKNRFLVNHKKKIELTFSRDIVRKPDTVPTIKEFISNIVFETIDNNLAKKPNGYRYPNEVIDFFFLIKFGPSSYDNLRWIFPIPCVKTLYKRRGQHLDEISNGILEEGNSVNITKMILKNYNYFKKIDANLSIDAIEITLFHKSESIIKNLFIFFIIPTNNFMKPFAIRVFPYKNGKANSKILSIIDELTCELFSDESIINLHYTSVDGDTGYNPIFEIEFKVFFDYFSQHGFEGLTDEIERFKLFQSQKKNV